MHRFHFTLHLRSLVKNSSVSITRKDIDAFGTDSFVRPQAVTVINSKRERERELELENLIFQGL